MFTVRYDDGYVQRGVELHRLRPILDEVPALRPPTLLGGVSQAVAEFKDTKTLTTCSTRDDGSKTVLTDATLRDTWRVLGEGCWGERSREVCPGEQGLGASMASLQRRRASPGEDVLADAQEHYGCSQASQLREEVIAAEAEELRQRVDELVKEAVASNDWWRLQAATQIVVSSGLGEEKAAELRAAMCAHRLRTETRKAEPRRPCSGCCWASAAEFLPVERSWSRETTRCTGDLADLAQPSDAADLIEAQSSRLALLEFDEAERLTSPTSGRPPRETFRWEACTADSPPRFAGWSCRGWPPMRRRV